MIDIVLDAVTLFCQALELMIFISIILSWIPALANNAVGKFVYSITEPILAPIRKMISISPLGGSGSPLDFSPLIAFLFLDLAQSVIKEIIKAL